MEMERVVTSQNEAYKDTQKNAEQSEIVSFFIKSANSPPCTLWLLIDLTTSGKEHRRLASEPSINVVFFGSYFS
jgi:hypothetical protein